MYFEHMRLQIFIFSFISAIVCTSPSRATSQISSNHDVDLELKLALPGTSASEPMQPNLIHDALPTEKSEGKKRKAKEQITPQQLEARRLKGRLQARRRRQRIKDQVSLI